MEEEMVTEAEVEMEMGTEEAMEVEEETEMGEEVAERLVATMPSLEQHRAELTKANDERSDRPGWCSAPQAPACGVH